LGQMTRERRLHENQGILRSFCKIICHLLLRSWLMCVMVINDYEPITKCEIFVSILGSLLCRCSRSICLWLCPRCMDIWLLFCSQFEFGLWRHSGRLGQMTGAKYFFILKIMQFVSSIQYIV
jgi:hypothetical protein